MQQIFQITIAQASMTADLFPVPVGPTTTMKFDFDPMARRISNIVRTMTYEKSFFLCKGNVCKDWEKDSLLN
jgi:hypothetical protein